MITEHAKEEIRRELKNENFKRELIRDTIQLIILFIEEYREDKSIFYKREIPGVVKRLVEEYSNDKYQVKEIAV